MKKTYCIALLMAGVLLLTACTPQNSRSDEDASSALGFRTTYSFSDMIYYSERVFTFYKPQEYDVVESGSGKVEINGNSHNFGTCFKRYKVKVEDVIYSRDGEAFSEIKVRELYKDAMANKVVEIDDMAALKENTLYLGFAYETSEDEYTPFEYFEIDKKGRLKDLKLTKPWKNIDDVKYTYEKELDGKCDISVPTLTKIKFHFVSQYGEELFVPTNFNYKVLSDKFIASEEYKAAAEFPEDEFEKTAKNTGQPYFEVIAYLNGSKAAAAIRYDAETGDAIAWTKKVHN